MENIKSSNEKKTAYLVGNENDLVLLSHEEYNNLWDRNVAAPKIVHKGYFYNTFDYGLNNGLFINDSADMMAEVRNGQLYRG